MTHSIIFTRVEELESTVSELQGKVDTLEGIVSEFQDAHRIIQELLHEHCERIRAMGSAVYQIDRALFPGRQS